MGPTNSTNGLEGKFVVFEDHARLRRLIIKLKYFFGKTTFNYKLEITNIEI